MGNEIYDDLDELPAPPRVDIPDADLVLLDRAARVIGAERVEVVDGEGYVNLHFADGSIVHCWNPLHFRGDALDLVVALKLNVYVYDQETRVLGSNLQSTTEQHGADATAATCRAIVRTAAEMNMRAS
jgi:hypothetical protein